MAKRSKEPDENGMQAHEDVGKAPEAIELKRYATMVPQTIINGHVLTVGTVVELTEEECATHRSNGLPLDDVHAEDKREVYSVREPYAVPDSD